MVVKEHQYGLRFFSFLDAALIICGVGLVTAVVSAQESTITPDESTGETQPACPGTPSYIVSQWVNAVNTGDETAFEATFAPNPVVTDSGRRFEGMDTIRVWSDRELMGVDGSIEVIREESAENGIVLNVQYRSGVYNGPARYIFAIQNGLIQSIDMVPPIPQTESSEVAPEAATPDALTQLPLGARCYVEAVNHQDLDALVASFAPDGMVIDVSRRIEGADAVRRWADNEVIGGSLEVIQVTMIEGSYQTLVHWAAEGSNGFLAYYTFTPDADGLTLVADLQYAPAEAEAAATSIARQRENVLRDFVERINAGDSEGVAELFADDAQFDSIGHIYDGRDEIMNRFLIPEVIILGGQYEILNVQQDNAETVTFEFNFRSGSLFEHFTYQCVVREGLIRNCVGRYL